MKFSIILLLWWHIFDFAILSTSIVAVQEYNVKIVVTPPTGPYLIDGTIELSCLIDPAPPGPVIYKWRALTGLYGYWEPDGQNISYTPSSDFLDFRHLWFYCRAFPNTVKAPALAEGKKVIEICGFISPLGHPVHTFAIGEKVSLKVNISAKCSQAGHIQGLTWYHNGSQIRSMHPDARIQNNGTELVIANAKSSHAGIYQAKISALDLGRPDCDAKILPEMEYLAMTAPVTFILTQDRAYEYNPLDYLPRKRYFIKTDSEVDIVLSNKYRLHENTTQELVQYHSERWFHEGTSIYTQLNPKYSSTVRGGQNLGELLFSMEISNATTDDLGEYIGIITTNMYQLTSWCREYDYSFLPYFLFDIPIAVSYFSLEAYTNFQVCVKANGTQDHCKLLEMVDNMYISEVIHQSCNCSTDQASSISRKETVSVPAIYFCDSLFLQGVVTGLFLSALVTVLVLRVVMLKKNMHQTRRKCSHCETISVKNQFQ